MKCQAIVALLALAGVPASPWTPCDASDVDPWVTERRDLTMHSSPLVGYAVERYGPLASCEGAVTEEFDGMKSGFLQLGFAEGVTYRLETMPLETSIVTLRAPSSGFDDEDAARLLLESYSANIGLHIDWSAPMATTEGDEHVQSFSDPEPGLNAKASLIYAGETLVAMRLSMAL